MSNRQPVGQPGSLLGTLGIDPFGLEGPVRTPNPNCMPHNILYHLPPIILISAPFRHSSGVVSVPLGAQPPPSFVGQQLPEPRFPSSGSVSCSRTAAASSSLGGDGSQAGHIEQTSSILTGQKANGISFRTESSSVAFAFISTFHWSIESIGGTPLAMCRSSVASTPTSVVNVLYPVCDSIAPDQLHNYQPTTESSGAGRCRVPGSLTIAHVDECI